MKILRRSDLLALPDPQYLIEGVFPCDSLVMVYGEPNAGKTFAALDIAYSISSGLRWHDRVSACGDVLYLLAEGRRGLNGRLLALEQTYGVEARRFYALPDQPNFLEIGTAAEIIKATEELDCKPVCIVVDTLMRHMADGEENSTRDAGRVISTCDALRTKFQCAIILIHHTGKDGKSERGASAFRGAMDTMILVRRDGNGITLKCEKQKDDEPFEPLNFDLVQVTLANGKSSLVLQKKNGPLLATRAQLSPNHQRALTTLASCPGMRNKEWMRAAGIKPGSEGKVVRKLRELGLVECQGGIYRPSEQSAIYIAMPSNRYPDSSNNPLSALSLPHRGDSLDSESKSGSPIEGEAAPEPSTSTVASTGITP